MVTKLIPFLNLQLFADGTGGEGTGVGVADAVSQEGVEVASPEPTTEDRNAKYEAFIKEHKDLDDARIQSLMQKRLKGTKETVEKYEKTVPVLELLSKKYGVDASDIDALTKAMNDDDSYFEEEAMQKGISVEQLKEFRRMEKENAELRKMRDEQERKANADRIYAEWTKQAEATKLVYPNFNLENEVINNPQFVDLIRNNIDVRTAYEVTHKDDIIAGAMQFAAKEAEAKVTNRVIANGSRPNENGISSRGASQVKSDVSKLTKAERDDIARRVARGEKIDLSKGYYR
jgi:hypothetical protein